MNNYVLPGFLSPPSDNNDRRLLIPANGDIVVEVARGEFVNQLALPELQVYISQDFGPRTTPRVIDHSQITLFVATEAQEPVMTLRLNAREIGLATGNYTLRVLSPKAELLARDLVVNSSPDNLLDWTERALTTEPPQILAQDVPATTTTTTTTTP